VVLLDPGQLCRIYLLLRMSLALNHESGLILYPVIEQVEYERPDCLEFEILEVVLDAIGDLDEFQIHLVVDEKIGAEDLPQ